VSPEATDKWAVSLSSDAGRAIYSIIITAMSSRLPVSVVSAQDCVDAEGFERPLSVSITSDPSSKGSSSHKQLYLYKGDGETRLGRVINTEKAGVIYYFSPSNKFDLQSYTLPYPGKLYFTEANCSGTPYSMSRDQIFLHPLSNKWVKTSPSSSGNKDSVSQLNNLGECSISTLRYGFSEVEVDFDHPTCGANRCILKDE